jgi:hypothetical protein
MSVNHDPMRAARELREQLASDERRLGFFFGAGTSMAVGLPGILSLTTQVEAKLPAAKKAQFVEVRSELPTNANVEHTLDRVRLYRELIGSDSDRAFAKIKGPTQARELDSAICQAISEIVSVDAPKGLGPQTIFAQWLRALHSRRSWPVEIFTTNYDVYFEQAMELSSVPFFDGFVGSVAPFFATECVEAEGMKSDSHVYPCKAWSRLWKLHGSINWYIKKGVAPYTDQITRLATLKGSAGQELAVFPSREKYAESRKLPFLALQDRFRRFLTVGDRLLILCGYSFSDQHLNEILFHALRSNPHLAITALMYGEPQSSATGAPMVLSDSVAAYGRDHRNLTLLGPDRAAIGGMVGPWIPLAGEPQPFWDAAKSAFNLGDFVAFGTYLEEFIGFKSSLPISLSPAASSSPVLAAGTL